MVTATKNGKVGTEDEKGEGVRCDINGRLAALERTSASVWLFPLRSEADWQISDELLERLLLHPPGVEEEPGKQCEGTSTNKEGSPGLRRERVFH